MEPITKSYILIGIGVIIFVLSLGLFFLVTFNKSPQGQVSENCNVMVNNGPEAVSFVILSKEEEAQKYVDFFFETVPYNGYRKAFNFFYIEEPKIKCDLYRGIATYCYSRELLKIASSCPNDYILVLDSDQNERIRSSTYLNVMSINTVHVLSVLTHELGHAIANFGEEYLSGSPPPRGSKNCVKDCDDFNLEHNGCYNGCSLQSLKRSIDTGVMRTLNSNDYGIWNNNILREIITGNTGVSPSPAPITGEATFTGGVDDKGEYLLIPVTIGPNGEIIDVTGEEITQEQGFLGNPLEGQYTFQVLGSNDQTIYTGNIKSPIIFAELLSSDNPDESKDLVFPGEIIYIQSPVGVQLDIRDEETGEIVASESLEGAGATLCQI